MNEQIEIAQAAAAASAASKATYGGSAVTIGGWFLSNEFAVLFGIVIGAIGLWFQWHFKHREYKLKEEYLKREHELRLVEHHAILNRE
jgi:ABC-type transport system involved in cytochrome bd biosynthesis fused ATPase/permease subunit